MGMTHYEDLGEKVMGLLDEDRWEEAYKLLKQGEANNDKDSIAILALFYSQGICVPTDVEVGQKLFERAISMGSGDAAFELGCIYNENDKGLPIDRRKAFELFQKGAELGCPNAYGMLSRYYLFGIIGSTDEKKAAECAMIAAKAGVPLGMYNLALCYDDGSGVSRDPYAACHWYKEYLNHFPENSYVMYRIACCLSDPFQVYGISPTNEDLREAYYYASQSVERGEVDAHILIGWFYEMGQVVPQDFETSYKYLKIAADNGNDFAIDLLRRYRTNIYGKHYVPDNML